MVGILFQILRVIIIITKALSKKEKEGKRLSEEGVELNRQAKSN